MLAVRMQRTGRKGHAMFRLVVQDSRRTPTSGKVVAALGSYDPHAKTAQLDKEKVAFYLSHGAQPSPRAARLLKSEGVELPSWVKLAAEKSRTTRHPDKRRSTRPAAPAEVKEEVKASTAEESATEAPTVTDNSAPVVEETPTAASAEASADTEAATAAEPAPEKAAEAEPAPAESEPDTDKSEAA